MRQDEPLAGMRYRTQNRQSACVRKERIWNVRLIRLLKCGVNRVEAYHAFAAVYDRLMEEIPYEEWCEYVTGLLAEWGVKDGLLLELGCGTGTLTGMFADRGFDMIGIDSSQEMLSRAMERQGERNQGILYLLQDMREFELYGTVAAAVSLCDTMNYLTEYSDLVQVLRLVNNYLDPGGIFIFDLKTEHYFSGEVGDQVFAEADEEVSYIWENYYEEEAHLNQYALTLFLREKDGRYSRYDELHEQRAYTVEQLRSAAEEAGMEFVAAYDGCSRRPAAEDTNRLYVVMREKGKTV